MKDVDKKIILQLLKDAEQPIVDIAEKVGASRQTVSKKIKKFKESGVIEGSMVKLNSEEFNLNVRSYVFLQENPDEESRERIEEEMEEIPEVSRFLRLFGRYSGILEIWTEDREELTSLVKKIHGLGGVKETETFIVHSKAKEKPEGPFLNVLEGD